MLLDEKVQVMTGLKDFLLALWQVKCHGGLVKLPIHLPDNAIGIKRRIRRIIFFLTKSNLAESHLASFSFLMTVA